MNADLKLAFRAAAAERSDPELSDALWAASNTVAKAQSALFAIALSDDFDHAKKLALGAIQAIRETAA
jgi:hypothetical protein